MIIMSIIISVVRRIMAHFVRMLLAATKVAIPFMICSTLNQSNFQFKRDLNRFGGWEKVLKS